MKKNLLLIYGGGGTEHEISIVSSKYLKSQIDTNKYNLIEIEITHEGEWKHFTESVEINFNGELEITGKPNQKIDIVVPCIHGFPGETGDLQSYLEMIKVPYIGCSSETSKICFNKISTKLWLETAHIATTPFLALSQAGENEIRSVEHFFDQHKKLFIKASNQGSSIGCFQVHSKDEIADTIMAAFALSPFVVVEKEITGRELEVSVFEYNDEIHVSIPGEIVCPSKFYSYDEKYDPKSKTTTQIVAPNISNEQSTKIQLMAREAFKVLKLRHLSRIDFFLTESQEIFINEVNTFPGMTPISMFPKMMENYGVKFCDFFNQVIERTIES